MVIAEVLFELKSIENKEHTEELIDLFLGALRMNGQILGKEMPVARKDLAYRAYLSLPRLDSLSESNFNEYVKEAHNQILENGMRYSWEIRGEEPYGAPICDCNEPQSYILYTNYTCFDSPLRCGDCFGVIPLYQIPPTSDGEYVDIIAWQSDYQACDTLQMNCVTGERFAVQQMSQHNSSLSKNGIEICKKIYDLTQKPTYYYLYRSQGGSKTAESKRKCPICGGEWLLKEPLHNLFDFCCKKCQLLSNSR